MSKRTFYTIITKLPPTVTRETVMAAFHDHGLMIELNPLVIEHHQCKPPRFAAGDEYHLPWYAITDRMHYLPGGVASGKLTYYAVCNNIPRGLQTHCYAPMGVDIRGKWLLCGSLPGEPKEVPELGVKAPSEGLYIREDIDLRCNFIMTSFVKKTLQKAHATLVDRLLVGVDIVSSQVSRRASVAASVATSQTSWQEKLLSSPQLAEEIHGAKDGRFANYPNMPSPGFSPGFSPGLSPGLSQVPLHVSPYGTPYMNPGQPCTIDYQTYPQVAELPAQSTDPVELPARTERLLRTPSSSYESPMVHQTAQDSRLSWGQQPQWH